MNLVNFLFKNQEIFLTQKIFETKITLHRFCYIFHYYLGIFTPFQSKTNFHLLRVTSLLDDQIRKCHTELENLEISFKSGFT
jgi:hypothetical protein